MSTITGASIINKVGTLLYDANNVKWSRLELLGWVNDAQRALVLLKPEASSIRVSVQMVAGPRQAVPAAGWMLLEVIGNMGTTGTTRGPAIKKIDGRIFDETNPNWLAATPTTAVTLAMYNERDQMAYDVYPPSDGTGYVELLYSQTPVDLSVETSTIVVMDIYEPALIDYVLFRAKSKAAPYASDPQQAAAYYQSFVMYVTGNATAVGRLTAQMGAMVAPVPQQQGSIGDN